jgi:integrase
VQNVDLVETFKQRAGELGVTIGHVAAIADLGPAVAEFLRARNLPQTARLSPEVASLNAAWPATLAVSVGGTDGTDPVGVALAREKAQATRDDITKGIDPVLQRAATRQTIVEQQIEAKALDWTFKRCAEAYIEARKPGWRSTKHGAQWSATLATYAYPVIGDVLVRNVNITHITSIIEPHWATKNETINRVRNRIELVLDWATVRKLRSGDNPARWKGNLDKAGLADRKIVGAVTGHKALPADALYGFMQALQAVPGTSARCLQFVVLTACRSGEARLATWAEIDTKAKTWAIPGARGYS